MVSTFRSDPVLRRTQPARFLPSGISWCKLNGSGNSLTSSHVRSNITSSRGKPILTQLRELWFFSPRKGVHVMATTFREMEETDVHDSDVDSYVTDDYQHNGYKSSASATGHDSGVPGRYYGFRNAGSLALSAGIAVGVIAYSWGPVPALAGFLAGMLASVTLSAVIQARTDARRSAHCAASTR